MSGSSHLGGGGKDGAYELVVARAPAQVAGKPKAHFRFGRIGIPLDQRLAATRMPGVQKPHCTPPSSRIFFWSGCSRRPRPCLRWSRCAFLPLRRRASGRRSISRPSTRCCRPRSRLSSSLPWCRSAANSLRSTSSRFAAARTELVRVALMRRGDVIFLLIGCSLAALQRLLAYALCSTPATSMRYSLVPRLSSIGRHAARAAAARRSSATSSTRVPVSAGAAPRPAAQSAPPHRAQRRRRAYAARIEGRLMPQPTTAMSISVRGVMR